MVEAVASYSCSAVISCWTASLVYGSVRRGARGTLGSMSGANRDKYPAGLSTTATAQWFFLHDLSARCPYEKTITLPNVQRYHQRLFLKQFATLDPFFNTMLAFPPASRHGYISTFRFR